jgi:geranylgeranyl diphosphate synthase type I
VAILVGDLAGVYADRMLDGTPPDARRVWDELKIELNIGQYLDVLGTARGGTDLATARRIARYKSGKYTIERPLHLGAALAGRLDELREPLTAYGDPLGEAFQLRDDVLGVFGDPDRTGKPAGDDLREGKRTVLVATAMEGATPAQAALLRRHLGDPALDTEGVEALREVISSTGALARSESLIAALTEEAVQALAHAPITAKAREVLVELAYAATTRTG